MCEAHKTLRTQRHRGTEAQRQKDADHLDARTRQIRQLVHVVELDAILRRGEQATCAELAEALGVSKRTVWRYVRRLRDVGMPVECPHAGGYYYAGRARPLTLEVEISPAFVAVRPRL